MDVDGAPAGRRGIPPHVAEQLLAGEDDARPAQEVAQQVELRCGQGDVPAGDSDLVARQVDGEVTGAEHLGGRCVPAGAPQHAPEPCHELPRGEGLRDVVVRAELEADDAVHLVVAGRHEEHGRPVATAPQASAHLDAVEHRQPDVEHDGARPQVARRVEGARAVTDDLDAVAGGAQVEPQHVGDGRLVLDDEHEAAAGSGRRSGLVPGSEDTFAA